MNALPAVVSHPAFEHKRSRRIETLDLTVHEFRHMRTGAMHFHLEAPNDENVFLVAFRTVPMDSRGVAHILEHTVLCGSERYPVRDPFFWMIRRSLNTFMNAFTTSDYTAYPFASQNRKDFYNLLDVYLDAVFFSRLDPLDFAQEGHRIEFEAPQDPATDLVYRGIVFNEMKGDSSSPVSILYEALKKHLFPTTTYHYNSGGDPLHIPRLTYDQLMHFYRTHYHPGNAVFMTFGNNPVAELQQQIQEKALGRFEPKDVRIAVGSERRYKSPVRIEEPYGVDAGDGLAGKTHIVIGWLLGENTDLETLLKCNLLSDVLLDTSASPLRFALETTPLAGAVSPLSGLEETSHEMSFICGVEGSEREHGDAIESLVLTTLERVAAEGVRQDRLEACLHQLELSQREIGGDGAPFGLQLIFSCLSAAIHRGDPIDLLDLEPVLAKLREDIGRPDFIKSLVKELLLDNPHRVRLVLYPDGELNERTRQQERHRLASIKKRLSAADIRELVERSRALAQRQEAAEDVSVLPKVGLDDVPVELQVPAGGGRTLRNGMALTSFEAGTNGLTYHQVITAMPSLPPEALALLPVFTNIMTEIGSGGLGYLETQHRQHSLTGGISAYSSLRGLIDDPDSVLGYVTFSSRTLNPKSLEMIRLVRDTLNSPNFSEGERIRDLLKQMRVRRQASITSNGHGLAMAAAASRFRPVSRLHHHLTGLAGIVHLKSIDDGLGAESAAREFSGRLENLHHRIDTASRQLLLICETAHLEEAVDGIESVWADSATPGEAAPIAVELEVPPAEQAWVTSTQVNFCAAAFRTVAESHPDSAALSVLGGVLRNGFLHKVIREQGGAYGGGASHDSSNGVFRLYSYRDPNLERTFDAFEQAIDWVIDGDVGFDLVEEAILGIISGIDAPGSPAGSARQAFHNELFGRTPTHRRQVRSNILAVTVEDVKRVAAAYLKHDVARAVLTNEAGAAQLPDSFLTRTV